MWIRTQKGDLIDVKEFRMKCVFNKDLEHNMWYLEANGEIVGKYATREMANKVMRMLEDYIGGQEPYVLYIPRDWSVYE